MVLVKKKNNEFRFCVDYRKLNQQTIDDAYRDFEKYCTSLFGRYNYFRKDLESHIKNVEIILCLLKKFNVTINFSKCKFGVEQVKFLGHIVSRHGVEVDTDKIKAIKEYPKPNTIRKIRAFIGLASYYRRFIKDFAELAKPLHRLTSNQKLVWNEKAEEAFIVLKRKLTSTPILAFPNFEKEFFLYTDASLQGMGAVLAQKENDKEVVIAYASKVLSSTESRYGATRREVLAIVWACRNFFPYLHGKKFTIVTDCNPLTFMKSSKAAVIARYAIFMEQFNYDIQYESGEKHLNADGLSRMYDLENEEDSEQVKAIRT